MTNSINITGIILAGGQSRRFNQQDKGWVNWQGKPLVQYVLESIQSQTQDILINCNHNSERYRSLGYPIIQDLLPDFQGPLAGIQASLAHVKTEWVLICPCDTPLLPANLVSKLLSSALLQQAELAYPKCQGKEHYLPVILQASLLNNISDYLGSGGRSMKGFYKTINAISVDFDNKRDFSNFNCPDDLTSPLS